jgi:uncharacterized protein (TIGR03437 family)
MRPDRIALFLVLGSATACAQNALLHSIQVMGGSGLDTVTSISPDNSGNLYVMGTTQSPDFPTTATFGTSSASPTGTADTFVAKIRVDDWSLTWCAVIRPSTPLAMAVDQSGSVYITGHTDSPAQFPSTTGAFRGQVEGGSGALFVVKLDPTATKIVYSALLSPYQMYTNAAIAVDNESQAYVTAIGSAPVTPGAFIGSGAAGFQGAFVAKLRADGAGLAFCTYLSSSNSTTPLAIAVDSQQNVFVAGRDDDIHHSAFPVTAGVVQRNHAGSGDAFVMKFRSDGASIEFATLLGGSGGDSANFLRLADDGSIYIAGDCESGSASSPDTPFPTTDGAPFRRFTLSKGFVARLNSTATSLLFSTYVSDTINSGARGLVVGSGSVYVPYYVTAQRGFFGLNYYPMASVPSTAVLVLESGEGTAGATIQIPAFAPDAFAVSGDSLLLATNRSQIDRPVPSTIAPIGPLGQDPAKNKFLQIDIAFGRFLLGGTPNHVIDADAGYLVFETLPGTTPLEQSITITSSAGSVPFHIFAPLPDSCCSQTVQYSVSPAEGLTPATVTVRMEPASQGIGSLPFPLLLVSPLASQPIQLLPILSHSLGPQLDIEAPTLILPPNGGRAEGSIQLRATAKSILTDRLVDVSVPFQFVRSTVPSILTLDPLQGTTPATIKVVAQLDSVSSGAVIGVVTVTSNRRSEDVYIPIMRSSPAPLVSPTSMRLSGDLGSLTSTSSLQVNASGNSPFQVLSVPERLHVDPSSGTGPAKLTITADLSRYPVGTSSEKFVVQIEGALITVTVSVTVIKRPITLSLGYYQGPHYVCRGLRATISARGAVSDLPTTGSWSDVSPAPTEWNGYSFVYRSRKLPILSANPDTMQFDVQFPYDLEPTKNSAVDLDLKASDGTVLSSARIYGDETASSLGLFSYWPDVATPVRPDGSPVTSENPVKPGDTIRLSVVGAGVTTPPIGVGELPTDGTIVTPVTPIQAMIGGKDAPIVRQVLSPKLIGVADLDILVPKLAPGMHMLGLAAESSSIYLIPIWVVN